MVCRKEHPEVEIKFDRFLCLVFSEGSFFK